MAKRTSTIPLAGISLDPDSSAPLYRQLYEALRNAILEGQLVARTRLPSTRILADELEVSRNTVLNAFEQLLAEGYLEGKVGAGTYVSSAPPDDLLQVKGKTPQSQPRGGKGRTLSRRGLTIATTRVTRANSASQYTPFHPGLPALDSFPFDIWSRLEARHWAHPTRELFNYGESQGYKPLREALATYLNAARAVRCEADQVIMVAGSQQALDLAARVLLDPGDVVWFENPGYNGARGALAAAGAEIVPVPVDGEGLDIAAGISRHPAARMVYVSPSHQYPLGVTMSLARRFALLEWANRCGAWVLEDDYDSEYRYASRPLAALQGLDSENRVIYFGTFSKVLFPSLRLGYLVVPSDMVETFVTARALTDRHSPLIEQALLADFITEGHFARHIRRMRALYAERQAALVESAAQELDGLLDVQPAEAGMHLVGWLPQGSDELRITQHLAANGIETPPLSQYCVEPYPRPALLLGYAAWTVEEIREGVRRLAGALRKTVET